MLSLLFKLFLTSQNYAVGGESMVLAAGLIAWRGEVQPRITDHSYI
jgi:hypothetical protein